MDREDTSISNTVWWTIGAVVVLVLILWLAFRSSATSPAVPNTGVEATSTQSANLFPAASGPMTIEDYIGQNIDAIAPETPASGSWQVSSINAADGTGVVTYTDGTNSYTADFTYKIDEVGVPTLTAFIPRSKG